MADEPLSISRPYYDADGITIYNANARDILPTLTFDAVVTNPPYGIDANIRPHGANRPHWAKSDVAVTWDTHVPYDLLTVFRPRPTIWFCHSSKLAEAFTSFNPPPERTLIWAPRFKLSLAAANGIAYRYHPIYTWGLSKASPTIHDVFTDSTEVGNWWDHPATKPITLMRRLIELTRGTVLDPFMGSGTTLRAAKDLNRRAIGIEIERGILRSRSVAARAGGVGSCLSQVSNRCPSGRWVMNRCPTSGSRSPQALGVAPAVACGMPNPRAEAPCRSDEPLFISRSPDVTTLGEYICAGCGHHWDVHRGDHPPTFCTAAGCNCNCWRKPEDVMT